MSSEFYSVNKLPFLALIFIRPHKTIWNSVVNNTKETLFLSQIGKKTSSVSKWGNNRDEKALERSSLFVYLKTVASFSCSARNCKQKTNNKKNHIAVYFHFALLSHSLNIEISSPCGQVGLILVQLQYGLTILPKINWKCCKNPFSQLIAL